MNHRLDRSQAHYEWNNSLPPRLTITPGDTVTFETRDAADGFYKPTSTHEDVINRGPFRGHPLTGPVRVEGARPGDTLEVEILEVKPGAPFGWTAIRPGRGLLPEADFPKPYLQIWDVSDGKFARNARRKIAVPIEAFPGVMGTALPEPGGHSTMPPRKNGGNMGGMGTPRRVTARYASPRWRWPPRSRCGSAFGPGAGSPSRASARAGPSE